MRISKKTDYALRALVTLASQADGGRLSIRELAAGNGVPKRFLEQIMLEMREQGWVRAVTGRHGGYGLAMDAASLTLGTIVRHFDGVLAPIGCVSVTHYEPCEQESACRFRWVFLNARNHAASMLDRITLADVVAGKPITQGDVQNVEFAGGGGI